MRSTIYVDEVVTTSDHFLTERAICTTWPIGVEIRLAFWNTLYLSVWNDAFNNVSFQTDLTSLKLKIYHCRRFFRSWLGLKPYWGFQDRNGVRLQSKPQPHSHLQYLGYYLISRRACLRRKLDAIFLTPIAVGNGHQVLTKWSLVATTSTPLQTLADGSRKGSDQV